MKDEILSDWLFNALEFTKADLERLQQVGFIPGEPGNCNASILLYTLTVMRVLGSLIVPPQERPSTANEDIYAFVNLAFTDDDIAALGQGFPTRLEQMLAGLTDTLIPRGMGGVSRGNSPLWSVHRTDDAAVWLFNVDRLAEATIRALDVLAQELREDEEMLARAIRRLEWKVEQ